MIRIKGMIDSYIEGIIGSYMLFLDSGLDNVTTVIIGNVGWIIALFLTMWFYARKRKVSKEFAKKVSERYVIFFGTFSLYQTFAILSNSTKAFIPLIFCMFLGTALIFLSARKFLNRIARQQDSNVQSLHVE